jgi:hypothetical protein
MITIPEDCMGERSRDEVEQQEDNASETDEEKSGVTEMGNDTKVKNDTKAGNNSDIEAEGE